MVFIEAALFVFEAALTGAGIVSSGLFFRFWCLPGSRGSIEVVDILRSPGIKNDLMVPLVFATEEREFVS